MSDQAGEPRQRARVLAVHNEKNVRRALRRALSRLGCATREAASASRALACLETGCFDVLLLPATLPGVGAPELARRARRLSPDLHLVVMTDAPTAQDADPALETLADDFLPRPFRADQLRIILDKVLELDPEHPRRRLADHPGPLPGLVGSSPPMKAVYRTVRRAGPSEETVLLTGESGTGKELAARAIHFWSRRHTRPFVSVNCAALTDTILENELFGHEPQSFTGASGRTTGLIEQAHGGTLFLDEIGDASPMLQTSLLRFLQEREIRRVGSTEAVPVNVRVIAATNQDLEQAIRQGSFRRDLYYRLSIVPIAMPPLRQRPGDIPLLVEHFLDLCDAADRAFDEEALRALQRYPWPGNVRELHNLVRRLCVLVLDSLIRLKHLPPRYREAADHQRLLTRAFHEARNRFERNYLESLLQEVHGNVTEAARRAGLGRPHLHGKLRKLGINPRSFREPPPPSPHA